MPRPREKIEKSKDFKGSMKKLFKSLNKWYSFIFAALFLAMISAVISIIAPNKLSDLTNYITDGLKPNSEKLGKISSQIYGSTMRNISVLDEAELSISDRAVISDLKSGKNESFSKLSDDTFNKVVTVIRIDGMEISKEDQIKFIKLTSSVDTKDSDKMLAMMDDLPDCIYDMVKPKMNFEAIKKLALLLAILYVVSSLFSYIEQIIMANITNSYAKQLRTSISKKINSLPLKYFDHHETGDILSRVTNDVDTVSMNLNQSFSQLVVNITLFVGSIIMMFYTNWVMAITGIIASIIGFMFMFLILSKSILGPLILLL